MTVKIKRPGIPGRKQRNYFDGKELRDAMYPLSIPVLPMDQVIAEAVRSEDVNAVERFKECVIAQACNRVFGQDSKVAIMRETAWVSLPGEKYALRFAIDSAGREMVASFDKQEDISVGTMIHLGVVAASERLDHKRKYKKAWRLANPAHQSGNQPRKTTIKNRKSDPIHGVVRNGTLVRL